MPSAQRRIGTPPDIHACLVSDSLVAGLPGAYLSDQVLK